jgi:hypothetical protein
MTEELASHAVAATRNPTSRTRDLSIVMPGFMPGIHVFVFLK